MFGWFNIFMIFISLSNCNIAIVIEVVVVFFPFNKQLSNATDTDTQVGYTIK